MSDIEEKFEDFAGKIRFDDTPDIGHRDKLEKTVVAAFEEKTRQGTPAIRIWRIIMTSRITKLAAAAVIIIAVVLTTNLLDKTTSTAYAAQQLLIEAAQAVSNLKSVYIKAQMRTRPNDNFVSIQLNHNFVPLEMWKHIDENGLLRWRIEKPLRVAVMDGQKATMLIRNSWAAQGNCPDFWCFDLHWLGQLLNINGLLDSELEKTQQRKDAELSMRHEKVDGKDLLVVEIYTPAEGDYTNDYLKNKFISDSDHSCVYHFDPETKFLEGFQIYVHTDNENVLMFEITDIEYNLEINNNLFALDLPDDVIWLNDHTPVADMENYPTTPKETAKVFFQALADENWDQAEKFWILSKDKRVRDIFGGLKIISIGEPFKSGTFIGWFIPYEIQLKDGTVKKHNLAVRNDNPAKRWVVDGGL